MQTHLIDNFRGGISQDEERGIAGSFNYGENLDIRKRSDTLSCQQAMKKESAAIVTDLIRVAIVASDGNTYAFGNQGKIYKRTSVGAWSLEHTDTDGDITGAIEWRDDIYWCTDTKLKKTPLSSPDWSSPTEVSTALTTGYPHFMKQAAGSVYIADGEELAVLAYDRSFGTGVINVPPNCYINCINEDGDLILLLCTRKDKEQESFLFTFDPNATGWSKKIRIGTRTGNSIVHGELPLVQAGDFIMYTNYTQVQSLHWVEDGKVEPYGTSPYNQLALFGIYDSTNEGIYSYGRKMQGMSPVLVNEFTLTPSSVHTIGAVWTYENLVLASWYDGEDYGVDVLDTANKATGVYESLVWSPPVSLTNPFCPKHIKLKLKPLPSGCKVSVQFRTSKGGTWTSAITGAGETVFNNSNGYIGAEEVIFNTGSNDAEIWQTRVTLTPSANNTPEVLSIQSYI